MPATTSGYANFIGTQFQKVLIARGKKKPLIYPKLMRVEDMDVNPYQSIKMSGMGPIPQKPEGTQFVADLPIPGGSFSITAVPYGSLFSYTAEMHQDDQYGFVDKMWADMGDNIRIRQDVQAHGAFNNAFSTTTGYDATALCSTTHTALDGSVQSNRPSPDLTLSQTAIQAMQLNFRLLKGDRSLYQNAEATRLLIHPTNIPLARELLGSSGKRGTGNNELNALTVDELNWYSTPYLTRTQDWFGLVPVDETDIIFLWRNRPRARTFDDPFTEAVDETVYERFAVYVGEWRGVYGSTTGV